MFSGANGSVTGNLIATGGTVDYTGYTAAVTFNLGGGASTGMGGWSGITTVTGSAANGVNADTITGSGQTYNLTGANTGNNGTVFWSVFQNLTDSGAGVFKMHSGANGSVAGNLSAVGGTVDYTGYTAAVTFGLGGTGTGIGGTWTGITTVTGSAANGVNADTITGSGQTYNLTGANTGNNGTVFWSVFQNLTDSGAGVFKMHSGANGSVAGNLSAVGGTVDYAGYTAAVTFNLGGGASTGMGGWSGITTVTGSASNGATGDTSGGANQTYNLTALNNGNNGTVTWSVFQNLTDSGAGVFKMHSGADGSGAGNRRAVGGTADYTGSTAAVTFNLGGGASTGMGGWSGITTVTGSASNGATGDTIGG